MSWTTLSYMFSTFIMLWFAFKIFDLWCREQPRIKRVIIYSVVICFQNFRSLMSWTTIPLLSLLVRRLWFAFKIFDLWCREQLIAGNTEPPECCDLLSKFSIFDVVNNFSFKWKRSIAVVICFQNFRSLMSWTTYVFDYEILAKLWFAFKIFDLWCREQQAFATDPDGIVVICFQNFRSLMSWTTGCV